MDFNRTQLGLGIPVNRTRVDLASLCADELDELRVAYPDCQIDLQVAGHHAGHWADGLRELASVGLVPLEVLDRALVFLRGSSRRECPEVAPLIRARIFFLRVEPVLARLQSPDH